MRINTRLMIATLAAASSSPLFAQGSLSIYGRLNTSIERQTVGGNSVLAMVNNNSRIGVRGSEPLGNGLEAGFALEAGFQSDNGAGMQADGGLDFGRRSEVYLAGDFGKLHLGQLNASSYMNVADYGVLDQPNHDTGAVSDALYYVVLGSANAISYTSPAMHGLVIQSGLALHEKEPGGSQKNSHVVSADWALGAVSLGAGYSRNAGSREWGLRVHYTIGEFQIGAYVQHANDATGFFCNNGAAGCGKRNNARVSAMYTLGATELVIGYGMAGAWSQVADSRAHQLMLGCNYKLSMRTKLYAIYTRLSNQANVNYGYGFINAVAFGQDASTVSTGLRHEF
ncbi:porin [Comamonas composti]|uniref:porin n=1 Tax=Comamonas composti TaxID=408558 RepID=UPI000478B747|nr:porin [Comamonas composti]